MDASTRNTLINGALKIAFDATGLIPGMSEAHGALKIAVDAAPVVEAAAEYFQSEEGKRALAHVRAVFAAIQPTTPAPIGWTQADAIKLLEAGDA